MIVFVALLGCAGAPAETGTDQDPALCGEQYRESDLLADLSDPFCQWQVECLGLWSDVDSCVDLYRGAVDNIDACRMQECAEWLDGAAYVCETSEAVETPEACLDVGYADAR